MAVIAVVLIGVLILLGVSLALAFNDDGLADEDVDHADLGLPDRLLNADDIRSLRFRTGVRGYRMEDVDAALERITLSLRALHGSSEE